MKRFATLVVGLALVLPSAPAGAQVDKSANLSVVKRFAYESGTDITFRGDYVYAAQQGAKGGVHVIDISGRTPKKVAFVPCPGSQNDVAALGKDLLAFAYHSSECGGAPSAGVRLIDVGNPRRPRYLGKVELPQGTHTLTVYPGRKLIYASAGGFTGSNPPEMHILDVSDPNDIKIASTFTPNPSGCHDINFFVKRKKKLAFCPSLEGTAILDVSDPLKPTVITTIRNPIQDFHHQAVPSPMGKFLLISDENFEAHDCASGQSPTGAMYLFDIRQIETPVLMSKFSPQRGAAPAGGPGTPVCTSHNFNWIPRTRFVVASWYTGGTNVIDFRDPSAPVEAAHYQPSDINTWSSYWYRGRIYANDMARGLEVLRLKGIPPKK